MKSVYNDPAYTDIRERLHKELNALRVKYKDTDEVTRFFLPENNQ